MHDADALAVVVAEVPQVDGAAVELDRSAMVGLDVTAEQLDERRLPRAVLAHEGVHLSGAHLEAGRVERDLPRVRLRQRVDAKNSGGVGACTDPTGLFIDQRRHGPDEVATCRPNRIRRPTAP